MKLRPLTAYEVTFTCEPESEELRPEDYFDSGDSECDRQDCEAVNAAIDTGNPWAWCCIKVTATWKGYSASDYLGACSLEDEKEFTAGNSDLYSDMCGHALVRLNADLQEIADTLAPLVEG